MQLSVLMIARNNAVMLSGAVRSLVQQTVRPYEILVIDDGSADGTRYALRELSLKGIERTSIHVIAQRQACFASAAFEGIAAVFGDVVLLVHGGDWFLPEMIEKMAARLGDPNVCGVMPGCYFQDGKETKICTHNDIEDACISLHLRAVLAPKWMLQRHCGSIECFDGLNLFYTLPMWAFVPEALFVADTNKEQCL